jgi:hypothetical protein
MVNGESRNWIRFLGSIEGFYVTYGHWPTRAFVYPFFIEELRGKMSSGEFELLNSKIELISDPDAAFRCEDGYGNVYDYGIQGFSPETPKPNAMEWLAISWPAYHD